jgi:hypothetical protein
VKRFCVAVWPRDAIIRLMLQVIIREIVLLLVCLAIFPAVLVLALISAGALGPGMQYLARELASGQSGTSGISPVLWFKFIAPYLVVQAIRAYLWGQRSLSGRRWAHLYFFAVSVVAGAWSVWQAWDLFYFMYALGDMPAELLQFVHLESANLMIAALSIAIAVYCFLVVLDPSRNAAKGIARPNP